MQMPPQPAAPGAAPAEDFCYYISKSGETRGPTHIVALDALRRVGEITDSTLMWKPGFDSWQPYNASSSSTTRKRDRVQHENTSVFVENLPKSATVGQLAEFFSKCGIVKKDPTTQQPRIKLYSDDAGEPTGEALIIFLQAPSVDLAVDLMNQVEFVPGHVIKVSPAHFDAKPQPDKKKKPTAAAAEPAAAASASAAPATLTGPKVEKRAKEVLKKQEQLALSWSDGIGPVKDSALCIVVLKNLFDPQALEDGGPVAVEELGRDIDEGLEEVEGEVKKVTVFKKAGVVLVRFTDPVHAENCVRVMRGRWFDGRRLDAHLWDGVTEYGFNDAEAEEKEQEERMKRFGDFLEGILPQDNQDDGDE